MNGRTHALTALASSIIAFRNNGISGQEIAFATSMTFGGLLPDIDNDTSIISRAFTMSYCIYNKTEHREILHTVEYAILLSIPLILIPYYGISVGFGLFMGYLSHLLLDCFNEKGVMLFYPFYKEYISIGQIVVNSFQENIILITVLMINGFFIDALNKFYICNVIFNFITR